MGEGEGDGKREGKGWWERETETERDREREESEREREGGEMAEDGRRWQWSDKTTETGRRDGKAKLILLVQNGS